jgi:hypothetical protein
MRRPQYRIIELIARLRQTRETVLALPDVPDEARARFKLGFDGIEYRLLVELNQKTEPTPFVWPSQPGVE